VNAIPVVGLSLALAPWWWEASIILWRRRRAAILGMRLGLGLSAILNLLHLGLVFDNISFYRPYRLGVEDWFQIQRSRYWFHPSLQHTLHAASCGAVD
jgi:hypothetical protein